MSTVKVNTKELVPVLKDITYLFPKGSNTVPLGLQISEDKLILTVNTTSIICGRVSAVSQVNMKITVLYSDISEYLNKSADTVMEVFDTGVTITNAGFNATFTLAYSTVDTMDIGKDITPTDFKAESILFGFMTMMSTRLSQLYKKEPSVVVYGDRAVLKFPNVWVQTRTIGFPFSCVLTQDAVKLLIHYKPQQIAKLNNNLLMFVKDNSKLFVWSSDIVEDNNFSTLMEGLSEPVTLDIEGYAEKLSTASKMKCNNATVSVYKDGVRTTFKSGDTLLSLLCGSDAEFRCSFTIPSALWVSSVKALKGVKAQILFGGGKVCLRNQNCVMVMSAVL